MGYLAFIIILIIACTYGYYRKFDERVKIAVDKKTEKFLIEISEENKKLLKYVIDETFSEIDAKEKTRIKVFIIDKSQFDERKYFWQNYFKNMGFNSENITYPIINEVQYIKKYF